MNHTSTLGLRTGIGVCLFLLCHAASPLAQTKIAQKRELDASIRCTIQIDRGDWNPDTAAIVSGEIENLVGGSRHLEVEPILYLSSTTSTADRDKYWAPADILHDSPLAVNKRPMDAKGKAVTIEPRPVHLRFKDKGDKITFRLDARRLLWDREISSVWPARDLFDVAGPGVYELQMVVGTGAGDCESQKLTVEVSPKMLQK